MQKEPLASPLRVFAIFFWFSATSFYHGLALFAVLYVILTRTLDYGHYIFGAILLPYLTIVLTSSKPHTHHCHSPRRCRAEAPLAAASRSLRRSPAPWAS